MQVDIYKYAGAITPHGYTKLCKALGRGDRTRRALLVIATPGGDPHAGFRIARALQHSYDQGFEALVPRYCKSAGTMILLGATKLHMADESELGPLDIQIKKGDELYGRSSGLDMTQAVGFLRGEALNSFNDYMDQLVRRGLSTRIAADIAVKLVQGILNPIAAQIEPLRLAEMQRATSITLSYGMRLSDTGKNVLTSGLEQLVAGYPSHSFVIDRKEARTVFNSVSPPSAWLQRVCYDFTKSFSGKVNDSSPTVDLTTEDVPELDQGANDEGKNDLNTAASSGPRTGKQNRPRASSESSSRATRRRPSAANGA